MSVDNYLMADERYVMSHAGVSSVPTVLIDGQAYEGMINHNMLRDAICEKLIMKPKMCVIENYSSFSKENLNDEVYYNYAYTFAVVWISVAILVT